MKSSPSSKNAPKNISSPLEKQPDATKELPSDELDPVDEAIAESFPASDPPAFTGTTVTPSQKPAPSCTPKTAPDDPN